MTDWYTEGLDKILARVAENSGYPLATVLTVYSQLFWEGFIDYDVEKELAHIEIYGVE